ncbi:unnamed protein product [Peronospora belbahrii]|uniref:JmjC domain-containing protein n=1 Tax=Peronospora belbahrii TaxID=622444 RepID=A0AAU9KLX7_9STRA|nr:unnamed protein product [Peronospora belbahrii]
MAATGMGVDTPPSEPRQMLTLASCPANGDNVDEDKCESKADIDAKDDGVKRDSKADNEGNDKINNSCGYIPEDGLDGDSESSENLDTEEVERFGGDVTNEEFANEEYDVRVASDPVGLDTGVRILHTFDVGSHTVVEETTVVKKYSYESHEENRMLIERAVVSTLELVSTEDKRELDGGPNSYMSCDTSQHSSREDVQIWNGTHQSIDSRPDDKNDEKISINGEDEQAVGKNVLSPVLEELLDDIGQPMEVEPEEDRDVDTLPDRDSAGEPNDDKSDRGESQELQQESQILTSAPTVAAERQNGAKGRSDAAKTTKPVKSAKRKQSLSPRSDMTEITDDDSTGDGVRHLSPAKPVASTSTRTPKRLTRASPKKPKNTLTPPKFPHTTPLRRSTRVKVESPKLTYPGKNSADRVSTSSPKKSPRSRKHGSHVTTSKGVVARHQKDSQATEFDDTRDKAPPYASAAVTQTVKQENEAGNVSLVHVMGTDELAAKLKHAFQRASFAGNAPIARFQQLIEDDISGLRHLNVHNLLDTVNQLDGPILQLHVKLFGVRRTTGQDQVDPVSKAKARCLEKCPLRFPAPRRVAEHFIVPLAKELGLEYAMRQHSANLVSCPLEGAVLDWRFHRTETVVFQLGGTSIWKTRMSQVEYPLECFHPESWLLDDMIHVAKTHRVATMDKATSGTLFTPAEDVGAFNDRDEEFSEQKKFLLKPGSVVYLAAGAWFEVETQGPNALWMEVQLASMTYENLAFSALKQLAWGDKQWRMGVQLYPGNRGQFKATRHHVEACMKSLCNEMAEVEGSDLLPEYLGTEDMNDLIDRGLIQDRSVSSKSRRIEVDLTNPKFKLKHEKVFKDAAYRVNPVAVLSNVAEIPHLPVPEGVAQSSIDNPTSGMGRHSHHALKKTSKPHPKRKQTIGTLAHGSKHTYTLDELFGNDGFQSQLHVKFQCSAEHSRMVEWLRCRDSEPFDLEEFSNCDSALRHGTSPARGEESAKNLLRFLCFVGYVTRLKLP